MPESNTDAIDYYPKGWTEEIYEENYIEWIFEDDPDVLVRLDGTMGENDYTISPVTGWNEAGEEFVTKPISGLTREEAFEAAITIVYAMNGAMGRANEDPQFMG